LKKAPRLAVGGLLFSCRRQRGAEPHQAAFSQAAVSKALHIIGMFMPKLGFVPFLGVATFGAGFALLLLGANSAARSNDPVSWERATEKNRST